VIWSPVLAEGVDLGKGEVIGPIVVIGKVGANS
jgi:hypothetical protein